MKKYLLLLVLTLFFLIPTVSLGQALTARVLESIFDIRDEEGEKFMISELNLNQDSLYRVMETKIKSVLNLESISSAQSQPFIFTKRKNKFFKELMPDDISMANENPADLYLIFYLIIDPPYRSLFYPLVRNSMTFKVFIFGKDFQLIQRMKNTKRKTAGYHISSEDFDSDDESSNDDLDFFRLDRESFLILFDKTIHLEK